MTGMKSGEEEARHSLLMKMPSKLPAIPLEVVPSDGIVVVLVAAAVAVARGRRLLITKNGRSGVGWAEHVDETKTSERDVPMEVFATARKEAVVGIDLRPRRGTTSRAEAVNIKCLRVAEDDFRRLHSVRLIAEGRRSTDTRNPGVDPIVTVIWHRESIHSNSGSCMGSWRDRVKKVRRSQFSDQGGSTLELRDLCRQTTMNLVMASY